MKNKKNNSGNDGLVIILDTASFIDNVDPAVYNYYYDCLYERYLKEASSRGINEEELMSKFHIKWELEVHVIGQHLSHSSAEEAYLNKDETIFTIIERIW